MGVKSSSRKFDRHYNDEPGSIVTNLLIDRPPVPAAQLKPTRIRPYTLLMQGFVRIAAAIPSAHVANPARNRENSLTLWREAAAAGAHVVVFPELGLSAYSGRDLVTSTRLLDSAEEALLGLTQDGASLSTLALVGVPLRTPQGLYNCAAALHGGRILGVVPKAYIPNYREFEELRWWRSGVEVPDGGHVRIGDQDVPFGMDQLFVGSVRDLVVGVEICEDLWVQAPPSTTLCSAGATVIANLSASNFTIGKAETRRRLAAAQSERCKCAYAYVAAGPGESSTDVTWDADAFLYDNGSLLAESRRFARDGQLVVHDVDLEAISFDRRSSNTFGDCANQLRTGRQWRYQHFAATPNRDLLRTVSPTPFLPKDEATLARRCWEMFEIQSNALLTRMRAIGSPKLVLGISGGLDSTAAALVAAAALDLDQRPRSDLICLTMPGFGTSDGTRDNAGLLAETLGATLHTLSIDDISRVVLTAIGHPASVDVDSSEALVRRLRQHPEYGDVTLENVQARVRTLLLMTIANRDGGIVVGTGDLSEKALGWSTYAGDHIAMYDVNAGVPKTLLQFVIRWVANDVAASWSDSARLRDVLSAIVDTPISPELLPTDASGQIAQLTEERIGPYELHDFFLYHHVRHGARPARILDLASVAFSGRYDTASLAKWLKVFLKRFFYQQYKRSCTADAPKVGHVALSPRSDWRMPSDASVDIWLQEVDAWLADAQQQDTQG